MIEEGLSNEGIISTLHAPEYDDIEYTLSEEPKTIRNFEDIFASFENKGSIKKIICGKKHNLILTCIFIMYLYIYIIKLCIFYIY